VCAIARRACNYGYFLARDLQNSAYIIVRSVNPLWTNDIRMYKLSQELFALQVNVNWGISSQPFSTLLRPKQGNVEFLPSITFSLQKFY